MNWNPIIRRYEKWLSEFPAVIEDIPQREWLDLPLFLFPWPFLKYGGVYVIYSSRSPEAVIYVGCTGDLSMRLPNHLRQPGGKGRGIAFRNKVPVGKIRINILPWEDAFFIESRLIKQIRPEFNKATQDFPYRPPDLDTIVRDFFID